jgi:hypothetical protein
VLVGLTHLHVLHTFHCKNWFHFCLQLVGGKKKIGVESKLGIFLLTIKFNSIICLQNDQWEEHHKSEWLMKCSIKYWVNFCLLIETIIYIHLTLQEFLVIVNQKIKIFVPHLRLNNIDEPYNLFFLIFSQITYLYITHQNIKHVNVFFYHLFMISNIFVIFSKIFYKLFDPMMFNMVGCINISMHKYYSKCWSQFFSWHTFVCPSLSNVRCHTFYMLVMFINFFKCSSHNVLSTHFIKTYKHHHTLFIVLKRYIGQKLLTPNLHDMKLT